MVGIPLDGDGMRIDALANALEDLKRRNMILACRGKPSIFAMPKFYRSRHLSGATRDQYARVIRSNP